MFRMIISCHRLATLILQVDCRSSSSCDSQRPNTCSKGEKRKRMHFILRIRNLNLAVETVDEAYNPGRIEFGTENLLGGNELNSIIPPDNQVLVASDAYPYSAVLCLRLD